MSAVARRMKSDDFEQVGLVLVIQREAGGNIAELLDHAVTAIRARGELRRLVTSLTAQGRLGGGVVTALPFVTALLLATMNPGYFDGMLESSVGRLVIIAGFGSIGLAWLFIRKIVDIKV
jgi:tight adherence protein B